MSYPNDSDGEALRRIASTSDISRPMFVDFMIAVPDEAAGEKVASAASAQGYRVGLSQDEATKQWTCYCSMMMLLTYEAVVEKQRQLDTLAQAFGGHADGWGTFGDG